MHRVNRVVILRRVDERVAYSSRAEIRSENQGSR